MNKSHSIGSERGSSTLEFIFCAPLLLIIMFVAMELNERIEQRVTSTIAAGNAAWIIKPAAGGVAATTEAENLSKADILGTRDPSDAGILGTQNTEVLQDSNTIMSYSDTKRRADAYTVKIERNQTPNSESNARTRSGVTIGSSTFDSVASGLGSVANGLSAFIKKFTNPQQSWIPSLFPDQYAEEQHLTWSTSTQGTSNLILKNIEELAQTVGSDVAHNLDDPSAKQYRILAHHSNYLRRDPEYHPDGYINGALFGLAIGSNDYKDFIDKCFMRFKVEKSECGQENGFYDYVSHIHTILVVAKTLVDTATIACIAASFGVGTAGCVVTKVEVMGVEKILDKLIKEAINQAGKKLATLVQDEISKAAGAVSDQIEKQMKDAVVKLKDKIDETAGKTMDEQN